MRNLMICLWSIVALFGSITAQSTKEPVLRVRAQYDTVGLSETFRLEYVFENARSVNFSNPNFEGFDLVQGPFQSSQFSMVNGVSSSSTTYTYLLKPASVGTFVIPAQTVYIDNNAFQTPETAVVVVSETQRKNNAQFSNPFDMPSLGFNDDIFEKMQRQQEEMMKRHKELFENPEGFFNRPNDFFNFPGQIGPDLNEMFKNFDNLLQFRMPPLQQPQKPAERTYKL